MRCGEKVTFGTLVGAARAALEQLRTFKRAQRPYTCSVCGRFHLTSQPLKGAGAITADMVEALASTLKVA